MAKEQPTLDQVRDFAPKLMELTDDVLFGDVWERRGLSKHDRSLITVAALVALYRINELPSHIKRARENGIRKDELVELFTHLAFYTGWPSAITAARTTIDALGQAE
jgi:4-carboxymuconolactone decarboxylase